MVTLALLTRELEPPLVLLGLLLLVPLALALLLQTSREQAQEASLVLQAPPLRVSLLLVLLLPVVQTEQLQFPGLASLDLLRELVQPPATSPRHRLDVLDSLARCRGFRR
ncbi:hypothetical protein P5F04_15835 [Clostridium perfringens]|nr:hypothetical protein [Clostridium perfringens]